MAITHIELVGSFKDEVEEAAVRLIENPDLKEVEISEGLFVLRGSQTLERKVLITYERGNETFVVTPKR